MFKNYFYYKFLPRIIGEAVLSSAAIVYHRTRENPENHDIHEKGIDITQNSKAMYGQGLYTTYSLESQNNDRMRELYGNYILKGKVNLSNMLILDKTVFDRVHPRENFEDYLKKEGLNFEEIHRLKTSKFTSRIAFKVWRRFYDKKDGIVFTGQQDGNVVVVWNPKTFLSMSYSEDDGKTWKKLTANVGNVKNAEDTRTPQEIDINFLADFLELEIKTAVKRGTNTLPVNMLQTFMNLADGIHVLRLAKIMIRNKFPIPREVDLFMLEPMNMVYRDYYLDELINNDIEISDTLLNNMNFHKLYNYIEKLIENNKPIPKKVRKYIMINGITGNISEEELEEFNTLFKQSNSSNSSDLSDLF